MYVLIFLLIRIVTGDVQIKILHASNLNGFEETCVEDKCSGGVSRLVAAIKQEKKDEDTTPFVFFTGNAYSGTGWMNKHGSDATVTVMNSIGIDAACLGEKDFEPSGIATINNYLKNVKFSYVCSNVDLKEFSDQISDLTVVKNNSTSIGVLGHLDDIILGTRSTEELKMLSPFININIQANLLRKSGLKTIFLLTNASPSTQAKIVEYCGLIDVLIGPGDTDYPVNVIRRTGKIVPIITVPENTLGSFTITIDENTGKITKTDGKRISLSSDVEQDPDTLTKVNEFKSGVDGLKDNKLGGCNVELDGGDVCRKSECNFGNLIADSFVEAGIRMNHINFAPVGLVCGGMINRGFSSESKAITEYDLVNSLVSINYLVKIRVSGLVLMDMIMSRCFGDEFLHVSGIRTVIKNPKYKQASSAYIRGNGSTNPGYEELDVDKWYDVITNQYTANKMYDYLKSYLLLGMTDLDAIVLYIKTKETIYPEVDNRVSFH